MVLPFPVDAPGYLDFPAKLGSYAIFNRTILGVAPTSFEYIARVRIDVAGTASVGGWGSTNVYLTINANGTLFLRVLNVGGGNIGSVNSPSPIPNWGPGIDVWIRGKVTISSALCEYWYSLEEKYPTAWISLGTPTGTNAGTVPSVVASTTVVLGSNSSGIAGMDGRLYYFAEFLSGVETFRFDGSQDLAGVTAEATSFAPSLGQTNAVVTIVRTPVASGPGYVTLPGTSGNYLQVPDAAALRLTGAMYILVRERRVDTSPNVFTTLVGKGLNYRIVAGPYGQLFSWSADGATPVSSFGDSAPVANDKWVWYSYYFNPATRSGKMWYSLEDSLNPPIDASWELVALASGAATTIFAGTDPLQIGAGPTVGTPSVQGDIGYVAIKTGGTGAQPASEGTAVFTLGANNFIGATSDGPSLTATTGQTVTVFRNAAPTDTGYILFPGTLGNDLVVADTAALDFGGVGSITFTIEPDVWRPFEAQTIISKWANPGQRSYAVMMDINGYLQFLYSIDGTAYITLTASEPVPDVVGYRRFRIDTASVATRYADFFISTDGIDWAPLGVRQTGTAGTIFNSTSPLVLGAKYEGRLYGASIFSSTVSNLSSSFRLAPEHVPVNPHATSIAVPAGTVIVRRDYLPVNFGFVILPGTTGNYLMVSDAVALRNVTAFVAEARLIPDDWSPAGRDREIMTKTAGGASNLGWRFLLTTRGTLAFQWSTNGTSYANYVESPVLGYVPQAAKRVGVSFDLAGQYVRFWLSDDNRVWTRFGDVPITGAMFASTAPLLIGSLYDGAISNFSFRAGFDPGGVPAQGTEILLVDQTCLNIDPAATSFIAVTGQAITVGRRQTGNDVTETPGWLYFPGTFGNKATVTAAGPPAIGAIAGTICFDMRIAPDRWLGQMVVDDPTDPKSTVHYEGATQTIVGRWSAGNNHSWLLRLSPNGEFLVSWTSSDGATEYTSTSSRVMGAVNGEFRRLAVTMEMAPSLQTLRLFESLDYGDSWKAVGNPVVTTYPTTGLVQGNGPMWLGALEGDTLQFGGRIAYLSICNGAGVGGVPGGTEIFRIDQEALRVPDFSTSFIEGLGKTVSLAQSLTPAISGYAAFDGVTGEYCRAAVPNLSTVTSNFTLRVRINFTGTQPDTEQVIVQKWNTTVATKVSNKALTTNVATIVTTTAHKLAVGNTVVVSGVGAPFDGTFTVASVPNTSSFTYAKVNANIVSVAAEGDVTPLGHSFSLRRKGNEFSFHLSETGLVDDINAVLADVWDDDTIDWGWLSVTTTFVTTGENAGATVTFSTAKDVLTPVGTPLIPLATDWVVQGDPLFYDDITAMYMDTEQVTFGGQEDGTLPLKAQVSNISILNNLGVEKFGWDINSFAGIASDSGAFTAKTGENVVLEPVGSSSRSMHVEPSPPGPTTDLEPAKPGETTTILPAPPGPTTTLVHGEAGPKATLTAAPVGPTVEVNQPSLNRPWWPGTESDDTSKWWPQPAFTVQRTVEGPFTGGDYVRGSTSTATQQTAIRYPTTLPGWTPAGVGKGVLYSQPINYDTIEIEWNIPEKMSISWETPSTVADIQWSEVVIIRAAMGYPATVNDGQAVMRMTKQQLYPNGYLYDATTHTIVTPNQHDPRSPDESAGPGLTPGRWYYYALFFRIGLDWVRSAIHTCLLPRNHHHAEHLWNGLPPYYRYLDDNMRGGANDGDLKRWLEIFGYQFDLNREYVESALNMYQTDFTPMSLLRRIGENFGVPYEPGLGDYSYRALVGRIGFLYRGRGTVGGMKSLVAAAAKCDCDVTQSPNVLLLPDDSEFVNGTGNWAGIHDLTYPVPTGSGIPTSPLSYDKVHFTNGTYGFNPAPTNGAGMMHVWTLPADATRDLLITCGDGRVFDPTPNVPPQDIIPFNAGTPCTPGDVYGFSISCAVEATGVANWASFWPYLFFFKKGGQPSDYISLAVGSAAVTPTVTAGASNWVVASVSGTVPANAAWVVPAISIVNRVAGPASNTDRSPMVHFCGASIRLIGDATQVTSDLFIRTLTLTGPAAGHPGTPADTGAELVGPVRVSPAFDPLVIGEDKK